MRNLQQCILRGLTSTTLFTGTIKSLMVFGCSIFFFFLMSCASLKKSKDAVREDIRLMDLQLASLKTDSSAGPITPGSTSPLIVNNPLQQLETTASAEAALGKYKPKYNAVTYAAQRKVTIDAVDNYLRDIIVYQEKATKTKKRLLILGGIGTFLGGLSGVLTSGDVKYAFFGTALLSAVPLFSGILIDENKSSTASACIVSLRAEKANFNTKWSDASLPKTRAKEIEFETDMYALNERMKDNECTSFLPQNRKTTSR